MAHTASSKFGLNVQSLTDHTFYNRLVRSDIVYSLVVVAIWRLIIQVYAVFSLHRFDFFSRTVDQPHYWLSVWLNYDGNHYTAIAQYGYQVAQYAFFPFYPVILRLISLPILLFTDNQRLALAAAGLAINYLALSGAIYFMLQIAKLKFNIAAGRRAAMLLLFFPSAIYLAAIYNESLFLLLSVAAFFFAFTKNWWLASLMAGLASLTRLVGVWVILAISLEWLIAYRGQWRAHWRQALPLLLMPLLASLYPLYQWWQVGNPLQFIDSQKAWDRSINSSVINTVMQQMVKGLDFRHFSAATIAPAYDALAVVIGLLAALILAYKKYWVFGLYTLLLVLTPLASGQTVGAIRYIVVIFPMFLLAGWLTRHHTSYSFILALSVIFMALLSLHYLHGWWFA